MPVNPQVLIIMGSASDKAVMGETKKMLAEFNIASEVHIASAHRTPEKVSRLASEAAGRGIKVVIAGAGLAAHLAGVIAAHTTLPVIGVPLDASSLGGIDSLLSIAQMPPGIPVATVAIGKPGAKNAAVLAAQIVGLSDEAVAGAVEAHRRAMAESVEKADREIEG
jgi:phosphoribosylaminoimidazole carboxylase PurE protein